MTLQPCCDPAVASALPPLASLLELFDGEWRELDRTLRLFHQQSSEAVRKLGRAVACRDRPESQNQTAMFLESALALRVVGLAQVLSLLELHLKEAVEWPTVMDRLHEVAACVFQLQREIQRLVLAGPPAASAASDRRSKASACSADEVESSPPQESCCVGV